jgi:hypothetical protein
LDSVVRRRKDRGEALRRHVIHGIEGVWQPCTDSPCAASCLIDMYQSTVRFGQPKFGRKRGGVGAGPNRTLRTS